MFFFACFKDRDDDDSLELRSLLYLPRLDKLLQELLLLFFKYALSGLGVFIQDELLELLLELLWSGKKLFYLI